MTDSADKFGGLSLTDANGKHVIGFGITKFPDRKQPAIYVSKGNKINVIGYVSTPERVECLKEFIDILLSCDMLKTGKSGGE